jgi:NADH-quinone oxidoreductase subunit G
MNTRVIIDGKRCEAQAGEPVLKVATDNGIHIPHFCYHEDLKIEANCRTCLVEIVVAPEKSGYRSGEIVTSCTLNAVEGLEVSSTTERVKKLRQENLALLLSHHPFGCVNCPKGGVCEITSSVVADHVPARKYASRIETGPIHQMVQAAELDPHTCVACNQCVKICEEIGIGFLKLKGKGANRRIGITEDETIDCIYCGQCTVHCPVGAAREQSHMAQVEAALKDPEKKVIVQMAPSVRVSIGEIFGFEVGTNLEKQFNAAFRQIGFDYVFDVNWGADITTMVEAEELVERIKTNGTLPLFTSCCPGWVKFVEFYYPEMIPHLTTSRSPQIHAGGAYKTWWAQKAGVDPKQIVVVSIMPCTSKKYEAHHEKLMIEDMLPVDYVLTSRETGSLFKKYGIDLKTIEPQEPDELGEYSGAAAIYGASGGVMESALRTAAFMLLGEDLPKVEFEAVRGMEGVKKATVMIGEKELRVAVVATPKNARVVLEEIKSNPEAYHYIEFMACPGGCIGGGGQPIPSTKRIIKKRIEGLYTIDSMKEMRLAHKNPLVLEFLAWCKANNREHELLHTHYSKKKRFE